MKDKIEKALQKQYKDNTDVPNIRVVAIVGDVVVVSSGSRVLLLTFRKAYSRSNGKYVECGDNNDELVLALNQDGGTLSLIDDEHSYIVVDGHLYVIERECECNATLSKESFVGGEFIC